MLNGTPFLSPQFFAVENAPHPDGLDADDSRALAVYLADSVDVAVVGRWESGPGPAVEITRTLTFAPGQTSAVLTLPVMIRSSEEAIRTVPQTYKEASLALGASRFRT